MMRITFKKMRENAVLPYKASIGAAAYDLTVSKINRQPKYDEYLTGIAMEIPEGYVGIVAPRSSISNSDSIVANSVGVIDSDYRGEVSFRTKDLYFDPLAPPTYSVGERCAQILIIKKEDIEWIEGELSETKRQGGGYGSTGN